MHALPIACVVLVAACSFRAPVAESIDGSLVDAAIDAPPAPACFGASCRRITITIDHTKVSGGPHLEFPLLVQLSDPDLALNGAPNGFDLVFTAADGTTKLAYEREQLQNGELVAWVEVPLLSSTEDTVLHLYYGDAAATVDAQDAPSVWDAGYQAAWHLAEAAATSGSLAIKDSTMTANHATPEGNIALGAAGKIGHGARFDGSDDRIRVPQSTSLASTAEVATLSMWVNWDDAAALVYQRLLMAENTLAGDRRGLGWASQPGGNLYYYPSDDGEPNNNYNLVASPFVSGMWQHVAVTQDLSAHEVIIYIDGEECELAFEGVSSTSWTTTATQADWFWGGRPGFNQFAGMLDELRVSNVVRSAGWIATEHANQREPERFYTVSTPVIGP